MSVKTKKHHHQQTDPSDRVYYSRHQLRNAYLESTKALVAAVEARDPCTQEHSRTVSAYAEAIGRKLHLEESMLDTLRAASLLHDVGKIGVPDAIIAESYERIHRSNLVGMGILPLQFNKGESRESLGITGFEMIDIDGLGDDLQPRQQIEVKFTDPKSNESKTVMVTSRIDTEVEVNYYRNGGILPTVLRKLLD